MKGTNHGIPPLVPFSGPFTSDGCAYYAVNERTGLVPCSWHRCARSPVMRRYLARQLRRLRGRLRAVRAHVSWYVGWHVRPTA